MLVAEEVSLARWWWLRPGAASFSVSDNGVLVYATIPETALRLAWFDRAGRPLGTVGPFPFASFFGVELSPDGTQIAMSGRRASVQIPTSGSSIWRADSRPSLRSVQGQTVVPSGHPIVNGWFSRRDGRKQSASTEGCRGRQPEALLHRSQNVPRQDWPLDWSSKGIVYASGSDAESDDLWMLPLDGDQKPYSLVRDPGQQDEARVSPNARWLAYTDLAKGRPEVFVQSLVTGVKYGISTAGGTSPRWRSDGKELFYLAADGKLISVPMTPTTRHFEKV